MFEAQDGLLETAVEFTYFTSLAAAAWHQVVSAAFSQFADNLADLSYGDAEEED
jgi:hypothetical protein